LTFNGVIAELHFLPALPPRKTHTQCIKLQKQSGRFGEERVCLAARYIGPIVQLASAHSSHILTELLEYDVGCTFFPFKYLDVSSTKTFSMYYKFDCQFTFLRGIFHVGVTKKFDSCFTAKNTALVEEPVGWFIK
jgi:hypothetical protein